MKWAGGRGITVFVSGGCSTVVMAALSSTVHAPSTGSIVDVVVRNQCSCVDFAEMSPPMYVVMGWKGVIVHRITSTSMLHAQGRIEVIEGGVTIGGTVAERELRPVGSSRATKSCRLGSPRYFSSSYGCGLAVYGCW
jgi:hypothetical protein